MDAQRMAKVAKSFMVPVLGLLMEFRQCMLLEDKRCVWKRYAMPSVFN